MVKAEEAVGTTGAETDKAVLARRAAAISLKKMWDKVRWR